MYLRNRHSAAEGIRQRSNERDEPRRRSHLSNPMAIRSLLNEEEMLAANKDHPAEQQSQKQSFARPRSQTTQLSTVVQPRMARRETEFSIPSMTEPATPLSQRWKSTTMDWQPEVITNRRSTPRRRSGSRVVRPMYTREQLFFIWYFRTDLAKSWDQVRSAYNVQFPDQREKGGLQCKFYRVLKDHQVERVRAQTRSSLETAKDNVTGRYGVVQRTNERYRWMRDEHLRTPPLPQFQGAKTSPSIQQSCLGCSECGSP